VKILTAIITIQMLFCTIAFSSIAPVRLSVASEFKLDVEGLNLLIESPFRKDYLLLDSGRQTLYYVPLDQHGAIRVSVTIKDSRFIEHRLFDGSVYENGISLSIFPLPYPSNIYFRKYTAQETTIFERSTDYGAIFGTLFLGAAALASGVITYYLYSYDQSLYYGTGILSIILSYFTVRDLFTKEYSREVIDEVASRKKADDMNQEFQTRLVLYESYLKRNISYSEMRIFFMNQFEGYFSRMSVR